MDEALKNILWFRDLSRRLSAGYHTLSNRTVDLPFHIIHKNGLARLDHSHHQLKLVWLYSFVSFWAHRPLIVAAFGYVYHPCDDLLHNLRPRNHRQYLEKNDKTRDSNFLLTIESCQIFTRGGRKCTSNKFSIIRIFS